MTKSLSRTSKKLSIAFSRLSTLIGFQSSFFLYLSLYLSSCIFIQSILSLRLYIYSLWYSYVTVNYHFFMAVYLSVNFISDHCLFWIFLFFCLFFYLCLFFHLLSSISVCISTSVSNLIQWGNECNGLIFSSNKGV